MAKKSNEDREIAREARGFKRGMGHFYLYLIGAAALMMILSPIFNRYLETYQAVVIEPRDGEAEVMLHDTRVVERSLPSDVRLEAGDYLLKKRMSWYPMKIERSQLKDDPRVEDPARQPPVLLPDYYERYVVGWGGVVTKVDVRKLPTGASSWTPQPRERAVITLVLDGGGTRTMEIPEDLAPAVRVGTRMEKAERAWLPRIVAQGVKATQDSGSAASGDDAPSGEGEAAAPTGEAPTGDETAPPSGDASAP